MANMSNWGKLKGNKAGAKNKGVTPVKTTPRRNPAGSGSYLKKGKK